MATVTHLPVSQAGDTSGDATLAEVEAWAAPYFLKAGFKPEVMATLNPYLAVAMTALRTAPPRP